MGNDNFISARTAIEHTINIEPGTLVPRFRDKISLLIKMEIFGLLVSFVVFVFMCLGIKKSVELEKEMYVFRRALLWCRKGMWRGIPFQA